MSTDNEQYTFNISQADPFKARYQATLNYQKNPNDTPENIAIISDIDDLKRASYSLLPETLRDPTNPHQEKTLDELAANPMDPESLDRAFVLMGIKSSSIALQVDETSIGGIFKVDNHDLGTELMRVARTRDALMAMSDYVENSDVRVFVDEGDLELTPSGEIDQDDMSKPTITIQGSDPDNPVILTGDDAKEQIREAHNQARYASMNVQVAHRAMAKGIVDNVLEPSDNDTLSIN